ncbi:hypothetical protein B0H19DRAFT_1267067 [Mycena capillaripes]|nr:hypothetical protein B0H19DRAFT_1267067 [Mycena capillaripes]
MSAFHLTFFWLCGTTPQYSDVFAKLVAAAPECVETLREAYEDTHWKSLIRRFRKTAGDAGQQGTSGLKHKTNYIPADPTKSISATLSVSESKSDRVVNHPVLRDAIIPWFLCLKIHVGAAVEDGNDAAKALLTLEATAALEALLSGSRTTRPIRGMGCYAVHSYTGFYFYSLYVLLILRESGTGSTTHLFEDSDDPWAEETHAKYQKGVFACGDSAASDDEDDENEVAMICSCRAAQSSTASSD